MNLTRGKDAHEQPLYSLPSRMTQREPGAAVNQLEGKKKRHQPNGSCKDSLGQQEPSTPAVKREKSDISRMNLTRGKSLNRGSHLKI